MLDISNMAYSLDTIQTQKRKKKWVQNLKDDIQNCYQGFTAIPILSFPINKIQIYHIQYILYFINKTTNIRGF